MAGSDEEFELVRSEPDPLRRGRLATDLLAKYQQRSIELARLRREAIDQLRTERRLSYADVAAEFGLSKGRVGQIRQTGPAVERGLFGVGPITVAVPLRPGGSRALPVIASEDALALERLTRLLEHLLFQVQTLRIPVSGEWTPAGDVVAICGPKSSSVIANALTADPILEFTQNSAGKWVIVDRETGKDHRSPLDESPNNTTDVAYLGRLPVGDGTMLVIAGVHALGSLGVVDYLTRHLGELYKEVGQRRFSMVVRSQHDGETVKGSEALCPPRVHQ